MSDERIFWMLSACARDECPRCLYGEGVDRTLMPTTWAGLGTWEFSPREFALDNVTVFPLIAEDDE